MAVTRVIELIAGSTKSWEDAVENAVREASKTAKGIHRVYIKNLMCNVSGGKIVDYRVEVRITVQSASQE